MKYRKFIIHQYKGIENDLEIDLDKSGLLALIGLNECGKSTILKAILSFDSYNDKTDNETHHLSRLKNYYNTRLPERLKVSAIIKLSDSPEFKNEIFNFIENNNLYSEFGIERNTNEDNTLLEEIDIESEKFGKRYKSFLSANPIITREYSPNGSVYTFSNGKIDLSATYQDALSKIILKFLPICLYLNDKLKIEDHITIDNNNTTSFWFEIFDNLFQKACHKKLMQVANNQDESEQKTDLNSVNQCLEKDFNQAWAELGMDSEFTNKIKLYVDIKRDVNGHNYLKVSIQELVQGKPSENNFDINERSDGFKWYYSFVMHLLYNPIYKNEYNHNVLFLLDEPGSNLNPKSQIGLLKRFSEIITENENTQIIYTTHSSYMLCNEFIKPNQILIAKKDKLKSIVLYDLKSYPSKYTKLSALTPFYDSLQLPSTDRMIKNKKTIIVEGIHDFYAMELFCDLDKDYEIFPCWGATSIIKNLPFFLMWHIPFVYMVDNDKEGVVKARNEIEKLYCLNKDIVLPFDGYEQNPDDKFEMDDIFKDKINAWAQKLGCANSYRRIIEYMYNNKTKPNVKELLKDEDIKQKFNLIKEKILEKFGS